MINIYMNRLYGPGSVFKTQFKAVAVMVALAVVNSVLCSDSKSPQNKWVILGAWVQPQSVQAKSWQEAFSNFEKQTGVTLALQNIYVNANDGMTHVPEQPDQVLLNHNASRHVVTMISYRSVAYADVIAGRSDDSLSQLARRIHDTPGPVYLRLNWEMDGKKRQVFGTPAEFIQSWRYIHQFMRSRKLTNIHWSWCPNAPAFEGDFSWHKDARDFYPGDQYVDFIAADGYSAQNKNPYRSPESIFGRSLAFAKQHHKPLMIAETGVGHAIAPEEQAKYIRELASWIKRNPQVTVLVWFSANGEFKGESNYSITDSSAQMKAFRMLGQDSYFQKTAF